LKLTETQPGPEKKFVLNEHPV